MGSKTACIIRRDHRFDVGSFQRPLGHVGVDLVQERGDDDQFGVGHMLSSKQSHACRHKGDDSLRYEIHGVLPRPWIYTLRSRNKPATPNRMTTVATASADRKSV